MKRRNMLVFISNSFLLGKRVEFEIQRFHPLPNIIANK